MRHPLAMIATAMLFACAGDETKTNTGDTGQACTNAIQTQFPQPGATDAYYRTKVRFTLLTADPGATISVADAAGTAVAGDVSVDGVVVTFTPSAPLAPSTSYTVTLSYECGDAEVSWTTSEVGNPLDVDVTNKVYDLDLASGEWIQPAGVGELIAGLVTDVEVLVSPVDVGAEIELLGALGTGADAQDICTETFALTGAAFEDPYFELAADVLPLEIEGITANIEDLFLGGAFAPDGTSISGTELRGSVDTRPLDEVIVPGGDVGATCDLVADFGVPCAPCADGSGDFCLSIAVENIYAAEIDADPLVERTTAEIDVDPACGATTGTTPTGTSTGTGTGTGTGTSTGTGTGTTP